MSPPPPSGSFDFHVKRSVSGQKRKDFAILWFSTSAAFMGHCPLSIPCGFFCCCRFCVRQRRTLPNFVGLQWTLAKALRVFGVFYRAGSYDITFSLRKGYCLVRHKILSFSRTSGEHRVLADLLLKNFVAAAVFSVIYFLNVVEEFRSCLSKPEGSVCHFGLSMFYYIFGFHY